MAKAKKAASPGAAKKKAGPASSKGSGKKEPGAAKKKAGPATSKGSGKILNQVQDDGVFSGDGAVMTEGLQCGEDWYDE